MIEKPFWKTDSKYSLTRDKPIRFCKKCNDTSYELLLNEKLTNKCSRCGERFAKSK